MALSFESFVDSIFDDEKYFRSPPVGKELAGHVILLFESNSEIYERFSPDTIATGLRKIIDPGRSDLIFHVIGDGVERGITERFIRSTTTLYCQIFDRLCLSVIAHEDNSDLSAINELCYMWWDILPVHGMYKRTVDERFAIDCALVVMDQLTHQCNNISCIESALHGLGHFSVFKPGEVKRIINSSKNEIPGSLARYAQKAISGNVI